MFQLQAMGGYKFGLRGDVQPNIRANKKYEIQEKRREGLTTHPEEPNVLFFFISEKNKMLSVEPHHIDSKMIAV